ncbi:MAG: aldehyde dehydrogenase family protein [Acidobacteriota bacterium]|nr:aldehyde dehydrogenase family protein [Acidobacteriota bacterium]MDE3108219.1 aldehyde dehydrogenase family protein [Acidobacteriota bacterium]
MTIVRDSFYINGEWVRATSAETLEVTTSGTGELYATVPVGTVDEANLAVEAAAQAFTAWANTSPKERGEFLLRISEKLAERGDDIALDIAHEVGMPLMLAKGIQAGLPTATFADNAQRAMDFVWEEEVGNSTLVREPAGVVACITPWNYPLHQIANKVAAALAAGCTVVVKPSEVAPINAFMLADIIHEVGLPKGVFNLVTGLGPVVGEAIVAHPKTDMVSFTGSTRAGKRVMQIAAEMVKRVSLELGGKSANIILEDADLARAVGDGVFKCYLNSGQTCSALTRMVVPRSKLSEVEDLAIAAATGLAPADPVTGASLLGPLVSAAQQQRVRDYITKGIDEGARLILGGVTPPEGLEKGYYVAPTIFSDVTNDMTIAQEEIFGPVLSIIPYDTEEEAVAIANDSNYGLAGGVWAGSDEKAFEVARKIRTGQVEINGGAFNIVAPFGGYKQSGIGRELGRYGFEEFLEVKAIQHN